MKKIINTKNKRQKSFICRKCKTRVFATTIRANVCKKCKDILCNDCLIDDTCIDCYVSTRSKMEDINGEMLKC